MAIAVVLGLSARTEPRVGQGPAPGLPRALECASVWANVAGQGCFFDSWIQPVH